MLGNDHFYNRTIRKVVVAFGTMFNDIHVVRYNKAGTTAYEKFKVPLNYGAKEKYITRITTDPTLTKSIATSVPRISFDMTGMSYDTARKLPSTLRNFAANNATTVKTQFVPVPYDFTFSLSIYVRNTEDGTQILEQILPFFTPDFNVTINFIPSMGKKYDMPVILNSVSNQTEYEGDLMSTRLITWDLEFTAKAYIWPPVISAEVIRQANTSLYLETRTKDAQKVYVNYANGVGYFTSNEIVRVSDKNVYGEVLYFSNNAAGAANTATLVVGYLNDYLSANDVLVGDKSNATYTITSIDTNPLKSVLIVTTPNPISSEPDDEFGFSETITDFPNIT
jgi:FlaG/FlaF family flagellin (archaellin)